MVRIWGGGFGAPDLLMKGLLPHGVVVLPNTLSGLGIGVTW